MNVVTWSQQC